MDTTLDMKKVFLSSVCFCLFPIRNAYDNTDGLRDQKCHKDIEKFVRNHKCHRNILDQDTSEINKVLIEHGTLFYK